MIDDVGEVDGCLATIILEDCIVGLITVRDVGVDLPIREVLVDPVRVLLLYTSDDERLADRGLIRRICIVGSAEGEFDAQAADGGEGAFIGGSMGPEVTGRCAFEEKKDADGGESVVVLAVHLLACGEWMSMLTSESIELPSSVCAGRRRGCLIG